MWIAIELHDRQPSKCKHRDIVDVSVGSLVSNGYFHEVGFSNKQDNTKEFYWNERPPRISDLLRNHHHLLTLEHYLTNIMAEVRYVVSASVCFLSHFLPLDNHT